MNPYREPSKPSSRLREFFVNRVSRITPLTVVLAAVLIAGIVVAATPALRVNGVKFGPNDTSLYASSFGCVGDGTTDDTTCLQNAATAITAGTLTIPAGTYKVTAPIVFSAKVGIRVVGAGKRSTKFVYSGAAGTIFDLQGVRESYFGDFSMLGSSGTADTVGIKYNGVSPNTSQHNTFANIYFENYFTYNMRTGQVAFQCSETEYRNIDFTHASVAAVSLEDANAVNHNFYDCHWLNNANGITSNSAGTGGGFNLFGCGFVQNTGVDIQNFPSSRGTFINAWSEGDSVFLQMPQASTGSTVTLSGCSVNGSSLNGTHIRAGAGTLNILGGRYTASPNTFTIGVGSTNGHVANINSEGVIFVDGNPFTGANLSLASIRKQGVSYAAVGSEQPDGWQSTAGWDTAGGDTIIAGMSAGPISASAGQAPGSVKLTGAPGVIGTAGLAAGAGGSVYACLAGNAGINSGGGGNNGGSCYMQPGTATGAGTAGVIHMNDSSGTERAQVNSAGILTNVLGLLTGSTIQFGSSGNTFTFTPSTGVIAPSSRGGVVAGVSGTELGYVYAFQIASVPQTVAAASSLTLTPGNGEAIRITLSATAITSITVSAGLAGERLTVHVIQDGTGGRTIPTTWTNVKFAGGTAASPPAAGGINKRDVYTLVYSTTDALWYEASRAMNL